MKISTKLFGAFFLVSLICAVVGFMGYRGITKTAGVIEELGTVRIPYMEILYGVKLDQAEIAGKTAVLLQEGLPLESRRALYDEMSLLLARADKNVESVKSRPRSSQEQSLWDNFYPAWEGWREGVGVFMELCYRLDDMGITSPTAFKGDLYRLLSLHQEWVIKLSESIVTKSEFKGQLDPSKCALGMFLDSFVTDNEELHKIAEDMSKQHRRLHKGAAAIDKLIAKKDSISREEMMEKLELAYIGRVLRYLNKVSGLIHNAVVVADKATDLYGELLSYYRSDLKDRQELVEASMVALLDLNNKNVAQAVESARVHTADTKRNTSLVVSLGLLLAVLLGVVLSRSISVPITSVIRFAQRGRDGDLTVNASDFKVGRGSDMVEMAGALTDMMKRQGEIVLRIREGADKFFHGSETLAALSEEMNSSMSEVQDAVGNVSVLTEEGATALQQATAGIQEIAARADGAAKNSKEAVESARVTLEHTEGAVSNMARTIDGVIELGSQTDLTRENIADLSSSVGAITGFISTITKIADQTNLLALNAAIEAARAGEAGRGFAVVAEEVRKLAEDSATAAQEVEKLIEALMEKSSHSVAIADDSKKMVDSVVEQAEGARELLQSVVSEVSKSVEGIENISHNSDGQARSSQEMASAIESVSKTMVQVSEMMERVKDATDQTASASEGVSVEAQNMSVRADELVNMVEVFKVDDKSQPKGLAPVIES